MNLRARSLTVLFIAVSVSGCAIDDVPELGPLSLSASEVRRGDTVTGTAMVDDGDADMDRGKLFVTVKMDAAVIDTRELPLLLNVSASKVAVSLSLQIAPIAPKGDATVELQVQDRAGHMSNTVTAALRIL